MKYKRFKQLVDEMKCPECNGFGFLNETTSLGGKTSQRSIHCQHCLGTGFKDGVEGYLQVKYDEPLTSTFHLTA